MMKTYIEESKQLFKKYDKLKSLDICNYCCVDKHYEDILKKSDRFKIPAEAINEYNNSAKSGYTEKTYGELKYFTPRILELVINEEEISHSTELIFSRFNNQHIPKEAWTEQELNFFQRFANDYWINVLNSEQLPYNENLVSILIMLEKLPINLNSLLEFWRDNESLFALLGFAHLYMYDIDWKKEKMTNGFIEKNFSDIIITFTKEQKTRNILQQKIEDLFWIKEVKLNKNDDFILNCLYTTLNNMKLYFNYAK